jgi:hypothetical protein
MGFFRSLVVWCRILKEGKHVCFAWKTGVCWRVCFLLGIFLPGLEVENLKMRWEMNATRGYGGSSGAFIGSGD